VTAHGFDSEDRITEWVRRIREAAERDLTPMSVMEAELKRILLLRYSRTIESGQIWKMHPDVPLFTIARVKPKFRGELDRRMAMSRNLIKLNREQAIARTTQRFAGWASSIPAGGSKVVERNPVKTDIRKALAQLPFEERRVAIDQGYKLISSISNIIAKDGGAIAAEWHDHGVDDRSYNARPDHLDRSGRIYAIRKNWAMEDGLMKAGPAGYLDDITQPGEEVFCRCVVFYIYAIRRLPDDMITEKGRAELDRIAFMRKAG
jgi:hypothetical protein